MGRGRGRGTRDGRAEGKPKPSRAATSPTSRPLGSGVRVAAPWRSDGRTRVRHAARGRGGGSLEVRGRLCDGPVRAAYGHRRIIQLVGGAASRAPACSGQVRGPWCDAHRLQQRGCERVGLGRGRRRRRRRRGRWRSGAARHAHLPHDALRVTKVRVGVHRPSCRVGAIARLIHRALTRTRASQRQKVAREERDRNRNCDRSAQNPNVRSSTLHGQIEI